MDWRVRDAIEKEALREVPPSATQLYEKLQAQFDEDVLPSLRFVQAEFRRLTNKSEWWSFADEDPEDAALVLPVVGALYREPGFAGLVTRFQGTIRRDVAQWVVRVRTASPDIDAESAYEFARRFAACERQGTDNRLITLALALGVWRSQEDHDAVVGEGRKLLPPDWARVDRKESFAR